MLPGTVLSVTPQPSAYLAPKDIAKVPMIDYALGGVGLNDASEGLRYQVWTAEVIGADVFLSADNSPAESVLTVPHIEWVGLAFDRLMRPVITYQVPGFSYLYWFDSSVSGFVTTDLPTDTTTPFVALDDARVSQSTSSDVIVSYVRALTQRLCFRAQRDRYTIEYVLDTLDEGTTLTQAGMNVTNRFQYQLQPLLPDLVQVETRFVGSRVYSAVLLSNVGKIKPRIYTPLENKTVKPR